MTSSTVQISITDVTDWSVLPVTCILSGCLRYLLSGMDENYEAQHCLSTPYFYSNLSRSTRKSNNHAGLTLQPLVRSDSTFPGFESQGCFLGNYHSFSLRVLSLNIQR